MTSARVAALVLVAALTGCGDRAPPALWPEPSPPTLAEPIGGTKGAPAPDPAPTGDGPAASDGPGETQSPTDSEVGNSGNSGDAAERARAAGPEARGAEAGARDR